MHVFERHKFQLGRAQEAGAAAGLTRQVNVNISNFCSIKK